MGNQHDTLSESTFINTANADEKDSQDEKNSLKDTNNKPLTHLSSYAHDIDDESSDDEYDNQEVMVTGTNQMKPVYEAKCKDDTIISCIGQLEVCYREGKHGPYQITSVGTGTVISVSSSHRAFIITAAHNVRHLVRHCLSCDKYMDRYKMATALINNKNVLLCRYCNNPVSTTKYIQAKSIAFKRLSIQKRPYQDGNTVYEFGDTVYNYDEVRCEFIGCGDLTEPDRSVINCYQHCVRCDGGYDWAILSFHDDQKYYHDKSKNIAITNGIETLEWMKENEKRFNIFGIPGKGNYANQMVGMKSIGKDYHTKEHNTTHEKFLYQRVIDTVWGQSGSSLWVHDTKHQQFKLFGIHTGSKNVNGVDGNVAVLFTDFAINNVKKIISGKTEREPTAPIVEIFDSALNIKSNENYAIERYKIRFDEKIEVKNDAEDAKTSEMRKWCYAVIDSVEYNIRRDILPFITHRRLKPETQYEIQVAAGNKHEYGPFSKSAVFTTPDLSEISPVLFSATECVSKWMSKVLNKSYNSFYQDLKHSNGADMCELLNKIKDATCEDFVQTDTYDSAVFQKNIQIFANGCVKLGIDKRACISVDTFDIQQNMVGIIINLYAISIASQNHHFTGPIISECKQYKYSENDDFGRDKYIGGVKNGTRSGIGKMMYNDGEVYEGEFENNKWNGYGKFMYKNKAVYEGNWKDCERNGYGTHVYDTCDRYDGCHTNNKRNGYGQYHYHAGHLYDGNFTNDQIHGYGLFRFPSGKIYEGGHKYGKKEGYGKISLPNGKIYYGHWKNGKKSCY
eukprot:427675_1